MTKKTLRIPFIFLDLFCSRYPGEFSFIERFRDLSKEALPGDVETFVPQFYCFKQQLYLANGITSTTFGKFFCGAYMHGDLKANELLLGDIPFRFYYSLHETLKNVSQVQVRFLGTDKKLNLNNTAGALWIGKKFSEADCFLIFPNAFVKAEVKSAVNRSKHTSFRGGSGDVFQHEQGKALNGETKLENRKSFFLFVTNTIMTEENASKVVDPCSMFINQQRWIDAFSDAFWFLQSRVYEEEEPQPKKRKGQQQKKAKNKHDQDDDLDNLEQEEENEEEEAVNKEETKSNNNNRSKKENHKKIKVSIKDEE
mmetsp:Transcript_16292/g.22600  ORF Transcript_16292/g.22600 Transcript_16292/m.22600 type:complete len:311 (-) Transcript_16292:286-1218(-)